MRRPGLLVCSRRALLGGLSLLSLPALAAPLPALMDAQPYAMSRTEQLFIDAPALGRRYQLLVTLPPGYGRQPDRLYPALFYTDAPQSIALLTGLQRRLRGSGRGLADAIFIGLGYAVGDTQQYSRRRDYTPSPHGDIDARSDMPGRPVRYGEAEAYRQHLANDVLPALQVRYSIDPAARIYLGHSYGGLFGTHILLTVPEMFARYVLISPSLWYGQRLMLARERGYASRHDDLKAKVLFLIGGAENVPDPDILPHAQARHAMVDDMQELIRNLRRRQYPGLHVEEHIFPGEDHLSVYVPAAWAGLQWALPGRSARTHQPCDETNADGRSDCRVPFAPPPDRTSSD